MSPALRWISLEVWGGSTTTRPLGSTTFSAGSTTSSKEGSAMTSESVSPSPVSASLIPRQTTEDATRQRAGLPTELPKVNYLEMIFEGQRHLMTKYHSREKANGSPVITSDMEGNLDDRQVQARIHELYGYLVRELSEALQELK